MIGEQVRDQATPSELRYKVDSIVQGQLISLSTKSVNDKEEEEEMVSALSKKLAH